jgi:hypothetical protein
MKTIAQQLNVTDFPFEIKDKSGKVIYYEHSDGYWWKREYDSNGNKIYHETYTGFWLKREFDSDGNKIYYENSDGLWCKWEYDSNGNVIYWENSDGKIVDNRPKSCEGKVVEIDGKEYKLTELT